MAATYAEELIEVEAAKSKCLLSQSYWIGTRKQEMVRYESLCKRSDELRRIIASEGTGNSMTSLGVYGGVE